MKENLTVSEIRRLMLTLRIYEVTQNKLTEALTFLFVFWRFFIRTSTRTPVMLSELF